jgi:hypothetical protein
MHRSPTQSIHMIVVSHKHTTLALLRQAAIYNLEINRVDTEPLSSNPPLSRSLVKPLSLSSTTISSATSTKPPRSITQRLPPPLPHSSSMAPPSSINILVVASYQDQPLVHTSYPTTRSSFFLAALSNKTWKESQTRAIKLPEEDPQTVPPSAVSRLDGSTETLSPRTTSNDPQANLVRLPRPRKSVSLRRARPGRQHSQTRSSSMSLRSAALSVRAFPATFTIRTTQLLRPSTRERRLRRR